MRVPPNSGEFSRPDGILVRGALQIHRVADGWRFAGSQIDLAAVGQGEFVDTLDMFAILQPDLDDLEPVQIRTA